MSPLDDLWDRADTVLLHLGMVPPLAAEASSYIALIVQLTNTVVFFFSGTACYNFFTRSLVALEKDGYSAAVAVTFWRLPIIFVFVMIVRLILIVIFAPMLGVFGYTMDWRVCDTLCLHSMPAQPGQAPPCAAQ
jgi:hypothetical protein